MIHINTARTLTAIKDTQENQDGSRPMHVGVYMLINELCILALNGNQENQNGGTRPMHVEVYMSMNVNFHPEAQRFLPSLWDGSAEGAAAPQRASITKRLRIGVLPKLEP